MDVDRTAKGWSQLPSSTPLTLTGEWLTNAEYYSTIRTGDVDGDGRDDVVARGPFGIRTWFYDRRKTGGWERYLPDGYQPFLTETGQPDTGKQNAFDTLNALALQKGAITSGKIRDVWTAANPPDKTTLSDLGNDLLNTLWTFGCSLGTPAGASLSASARRAGGSRRIPAIR